MQAVIYKQYGSPDVLHLATVEKPTPKDDEVLIKVHATSVTTGDVNMRGFTFVPPGFGPLPRLMFGINGPKKPIIGVEVAGEVEAVGKNVTEFKVGDMVFGMDSSSLGGYAEYVCRKASGPLALKPENITVEEAAAIGFGGGTALFFLRDKAKIQPGQKVLIIGASGGVGSAAVQIAKYYGAEVTGVCSDRNVELVKSLGADHVIDYTQEDFTQNGESYDAIFDTVPGKTSFARCKGSLTQNGLYLAVAGGLKEMLQAVWTSLRGGKKVIAGAPPETKEQMTFLKEMIEAGKLKPYIDQSFPLEKTAEAHRYVDTGRKRGNVVITLV